MKIFKKKYLICLEVPQGPEIVSGSSNRDPVEATIREKAILKTGIDREKQTKEIKKQLEQLKINNPEEYEELLKNLKETGLVGENNEILTDKNNSIWKYIEYTLFLYKVDRNNNQEIVESSKSTLVKYYLELISEKTNFIKNKEVLQYKYAEAIIMDIKRKGFYISDNNGIYFLKNNKGEKKDFKEIGVYKDIFDENNLRKDIIDVAILADMLVKTPNNNVDFKSYFNSLIKKYSLIEGDEEDTSLLILMKKESILEKIEKTKLQSIQERQELNFLKNFIYNELWKGGKQKEIYDNYTKAKEYAETYTKGSALIDANPVFGKGVDGKDLGVGGHIENFVKGNQVSFILAGFISLFFNKTIGLTLLGAGFFGNGLANLAKGVLKEGEKQLPDNFIKPISNDQVISSETVENPAYKNKYNKLFDYNAKLIFSGNKIIKSNSNTYKENKTLTKDKLENIISTIVKKGEDIEFGSGPDYTTTLFKKYFSSKSVIKEEDLKIFLDLLRDSGIKDNGDETILDYLSEDKDVLNIEYDDNSKFINIPYFDDKINDFLKKKWDTSTNDITNSKKRQIRNQILAYKNDFNNKSNINRNLSNRRLDFLSSIFDSKTKNEGSLSSTDSDKLKEIIGEYKKYKKLDEKVDEYKKNDFNTNDDISIFNNNIVELNKIKKEVTLLSSSSSSIYTILLSKISENISDKENEKQKAISNKEKESSYIPKMLATKEFNNELSIDDLYIDIYQIYNNKIKNKSLNDIDIYIDYLNSIGVSLTTTNNTSIFYNKSLEKINRVLKEYENYKKEKKEIIIELNNISINSGDNIVEYKEKFEKVKILGDNKEKIKKLLGGNENINFSYTEKLENLERETGKYIRGVTIEKFKVGGESLYSVIKAVYNNTTTDGGTKAFIISIGYNNFENMKMSEFINTDNIDKFINKNKVIKDFIDKVDLDSLKITP